MMSLGEVKMDLQRRLLALAHGGQMPVIIGLHSVCLEDNTVHIGFDIVPGEVLFYDFEKPREVARDELSAFGRWLASSDDGMTLH